MSPTMTMLTRVTARSLVASSIVSSSRVLISRDVVTSPTSATRVAWAVSSRPRRASTAPGGLSTSCGAATSVADATEPASVSDPGATTNGPHASVMTKPKLPGTGYRGSCSVPTSRSRVHRLEGPSSSWMPTTTTAASRPVVEFRTGISVPTVQP